MASELEKAEFPALYAPSEGYLFVVTYGRSGSTLTQKLLNAIPGYCIRGENGNAIYHPCRLIEMLNLEPNYAMRKAGAGSNLVREVIPTVGTPDDPWYGAENVDISRVAKQLFNVFCKEFLQLPPGVRVGGFKEIQYLDSVAFMPTMLEMMQEYFPNSRILFLTRNSEQVASSSWWQTYDRVALIDRLACADAAYNAYRQSHDNCFHLDYATYAEGADALRPLFDFLGEPMDVALVSQILDTKLTH